MDEESRPGYYAIIPADVRYDDSIPANAKLLYGEISALIGREGFCFAANSYFMKIYGFSDPTVTRLITKLEKAGYIKRIMERDQSGQVTQRKIFLTASMPDVHPPIKNDTTPYQNCGEGGIKNDGYTITSNTISIDGKGKRPKSVPLTDEQLKDLFIRWIKDIAADDWTRQGKNDLFAALCGFYAPRENKKQEPAHTQAGFTALGNKLVRDAEGSPTAMIEMLERATISGWKSVYPSKCKGASATPQPAHRRDEEWL